MPRLRKRSSANFWNRYAAYARNHGMTMEQMRIHDKQCYPDGMLTPYLYWLSMRRLEWNHAHPEQPIQTGMELIEFDRWLLQLPQTRDAFTCECHMGIVHMLDRQ